MKLTKEVWAVVAAVGFLLSWLIDRVSGPISILVIGNPITFLHSPVLLNKYPFTATAIVIRTLALFISAMVVVSFVNRKYFTKAIVLFFVAMLSEFYGIQQLATGYHITTIQWTLSIAYAGLSLSLGIIWAVFMGIWSSFNKSEVKQQTETTKEEKSVLEPPSEE